MKQHESAKIYARLSKIEFLVLGLICLIGGIILLCQGEYYALLLIFVAAPLFFVLAFKLYDFWNKKNEILQKEAAKSEEEVLERKKQEQTRIDQLQSNKAAMLSLIESFTSWKAKLETNLNMYGIEFKDLRFHRHDYVEYTHSGKKIAIIRVKDAILFINPLSILDEYLKFDTDILAYKYEVLEELRTETFYFLENQKYNGLDCEILSVDDLMFWNVVGEVETRSYGIKPSNLSIATTEAIWGTAAAINKVTSSTNTYKVDKRCIRLHFKPESGKSTITLDFYSDYDLEKMKAMFPEKFR